MLPAFLPGHPLQKHTDVQWDIGAALGADHGTDESTSPQAGIIRRSLWRRQHSYDYRGHTAFTVRSLGMRSPGCALPDLFLRLRRMRTRPGVASQQVGRGLGNPHQCLRAPLENTLDAPDFLRNSGTKSPLSDLITVSVSAVLHELFRLCFSCCAGPPITLRPKLLSCVPFSQHCLKIDSKR